MTNKIIAAFVFCVSVTCCAEYLDGVFSSPDKFYFHQEKENGYRLTLECYDKESTPELCFPWEESMNSIVQVCLKQPYVLPDLRNGVIKLTWRQTESNVCKWLVLRMIDKYGEVFQFKSSQTYKTNDGKNIVVFPVAEKLWQVSWGNGVDKKIDWPLRFFGFALSKNKGVGKGKVFFESLEVQSYQEKPLLTSETLMEFTPGKIKVREKNEPGNKIALTKTGLELQGSARQVDISATGMTSEVYYDCVQRFRVSLDVGSGQGEFIINATDKSGENYKFPGIFKEGETEVLISASLPKGNEIRISSFAVKPSSANHQLLIKKIEVNQEKSRSQALKIEVATGNRLHILKKGDENALKLEFGNPSEERLRLRVKAYFSDFFDRNFSETYNLDIPAGQMVSYPVETKLPAMGVWQVNCVVSDLAGKDEAFWKRSFAYMIPGQTGPKLKYGDFMFGLNSHLMRWPEDEYYLGLDALVAAGAKLLRAGAHWGTVQPTEDSWDFTQSDRLTSDLCARGINQDALLIPTPRWAAPAEARDKGYWIYSRSVPRKGLYQKYAETMASRYRGKVLFWEVWNEADLNKLFTPETYCGMLKEAYTGIKKGDPDAMVLTTGFASMVHPKIQKGFQETVLRESKGFYDIHAYHEHGGFGQFASIVDNKFIPMRKRAAVTAPWFANETALTASGGMDRSQALTLFKKIMFAWGRGSISYVWYQLRNLGYDPYNGEHNYGLMTNDFYPKAAFPVFAAMSREYTGLTFEKQLDLRKGLFMFQFRGKDRMVLGAWLEAANTPSVPYIIKTDASRVEHVDLMGNRTDIPVNGQIAIFPVGVIPSSLIVHGATYAEASSPMVAVDAPGVAVPGITQNLKITLLNPYDMETEFNLKFSSPDKTAFAKELVSIKVPPAQSASFQAVLSIAKEFPASEEKSPCAILSYTANTSKGSITIPLKQATLVKTAKAEAKTPEFILNNAEHVHNNYKADPASVRRLWQGPTDLSAKVWLERSGKQLRLKIDVEDDRHVQTETGFKVFSGDNIQVAIQLPRQNGYWEIGLSHLKTDQSEVYIWQAPSGFDTQKTASKIRLGTVRKGTLTRYDAEIPFEAVGMDKDDLSKGFRFNMIINENDGEGRDGWMFIAPGIGAVKSPEEFPYVLFE
jgi:hypothetical protein